MWLRSEHISRRLRGRLGTANISVTKAFSRRVQVGTVRKSPAINNSSQRVNTLSRCGRLSRWRRRSPHLFKEVRLTIKQYFHTSYQHYIKLIDLYFEYLYRLVKKMF